MTIERKLLRQQVTAILKRGRTDARDRVFPFRTQKAWSGDLPQIHVYTRSEDVEKQDEAPKSYKRNIHLAIEIVHQANNAEQLADELDDICEQVENLMDVLDATLTYRCQKNLPAFADRINLTNIEFEGTEDGDRPHGSARMTYFVELLKDAPRDNSDIPSIETFTGADVEWQLEPLDDDEVEAEDEINVETT